MTRTFLDRFDPSSASPINGATVDLDVADIEDTGIRFTFREPLGQAREVKVALSELFGRFVARAYQERYFNLSIFAHFGSHTIVLDRRRKVKVTRLSRGDLPDWIACASDLSSLSVAEERDVTIPEARQMLSLELGLKPAAST